MIDHVDEWVRKIVADGTEKETSVSVGPIAANHEGLRVSLLSLAENTSARVSGREMIRPSGNDGLAARRERSVTMTLDYAVTASTDDGRAGVALGYALTSLLLAQNGAPPPMSKAMEDAGWLSVRLAVAQPEHPLVKDPAAMWGALGISLRPSIGVRVDATLNPYKPAFVRLVQEAVIGTTPRSGSRDVEVRTARASVAGQVVDGHTLEPLKDVVVSQGDGPGGTTNAKGVFVLRGAAKGPMTLRASHPNYGDGEAEVEAPGPGDPIPMVRILLPARPIGATAERPVRTLQSEEGAPEPYRVVRSGIYATVTDADGRYALRDEGE